MKTLTNNLCKLVKIIQKKIIFLTLQFDRIRDQKLN